ncbi:MAG: condensation domain-containing protein, partial [Flammeovirgaceae bacterium]
MTTIELKNQLDHLGIVLSVMGDNLNYRAPKGSMTPELLNKIKAHKAELIDLLSTTSANRKQFITLNPLQQRLVYVNQLHGQSVSYNAFLGFHFEGAIKPALLEAVFFKIIQRHEAFRSRLVTHKNQRCLEVVEQVPFELLQEDCTAISEVAFQEKLTTFAQQNLNFETCPLLTVKLYKRASQQYTIAILSHHFIIDGWSLNLLATELWNTYFDPTITCPPTLRLFDAEHQRHQIEKKHAEKEFKYWKQKLANATLHIDFPYDEQPGVPQRESNAIDCLLLSSEEYAPIKQIGQNYGASTFMVNTTALQFVLSCFAQQNNFVIGTAISNREGNKLANTIGSFSNTLLIDCKTDVQKTFTDHLQEMRKTMLEAYANSHLPYQEVVSALDRKHLSDEIVQVMVVQQTAPSF